MNSHAYMGDRPDTGNPCGPLETWFWNNSGPIVHKWIHYLPIYERYFSRFRNKPLRMLEIGVAGGGSLEMWRNYFGDDAVLYGVDINPDCKRFDGKAAQVRIGSQADSAFLESVVDEMGGIDIVLDDGSHVSSHIRKSFETLFPKLADRGIYVIEDMHACYWDDYGGGYRDKRSFIEDIKVMIDDMHHWYHNNGLRISAGARNIAALHIHDSIALIEKEAVPAPMHTKRGVEN